jgi:hypothetical protein
MPHKPRKPEFSKTMPVREDVVMLLTDNIESALKHTSEHAPFTSSELAHAFYMVMFELGAHIHLKTK